MKFYLYFSFGGASRPAGSVGTGLRACYLCCRHQGRGPSHNASRVRAPQVYGRSADRSKPHYFCSARPGTAVRSIASIDSSRYSPFSEPGRIQDCFTGLPSNALLAESQLCEAASCWDGRRQPHRHRIGWPNIESRRFRRSRMPRTSWTISKD